MVSKVSGEKPPKPYPDFPLFPHGNGQWAKKIRGKLHYFGLWADPDGSLAKYLDQRDDLQAGRKPRDKAGELTVRDLVNRFLTAKRHLVDTHEVSPRCFANYHATGVRVAEGFGKTRAVADLRPEDFDAYRAEYAKGRGPVSIRNEVQNVRILFKYAYDAGLIDAPIRFGPSFKAPSRRVLRKARQAAGQRMFEAADLRRILDAADQPLRAMVLLGINAGFGQTDCASLPASALDLDAGWVDFPRPKTAVPRRVPLWPESVAAIREALALRPKPREESDARLVFLTRLGQPWVRVKPRRSATPNKPEWAAVDAVALMFGRLLSELGLKRPGLNFYAIRHTFETVAGESRDQVAVNAIMGHDPGDMASLYRERIGDDRLRAVVDHVRGWLFG